MIFKKRILVWEETETKAPRTVVSSLPGGAAGSSSASSSFRDLCGTSPRRKFGDLSDQRWQAQVWPCHALSRGLRGE